VMQLLVGQGAFVARFSLPDDCRLVPTRPSQMSIQTIFRDVEFAAYEPLRKRHFPFQNLFPFGAPDELARFSSPEFCRLPDGFPIHSPILTETFDSRVFCKLSWWFEDTPLDQVRLDVVLHEQDRKSTRLNSSHDQISYAVFC